MLTEINWEPFVFSLQIFLAFVLICFLGSVGDFWFKGARRRRKPVQPVTWHKGDKVFLN